jgi:hypothetical protein
MCQTLLIDDVANYIQCELVHNVHWSNTGIVDLSDLALR